MTKKQFTLIIVVLLLVTFASTNGNSRASAWSNGGFSSNISQPKYGTHDWIAEHALNLLPVSEKQFLSDNLAWFLYGTELPDNGVGLGGVGDTTKHHVYFFANGSLQDNASALRAEQEYLNAEQAFSAGNLSDAAMHLGMVTHYIDDLAVFGHVMGAATTLGPETHHSDYEDYVQTRTQSYQSEFDKYLVFDQNWNFSSTYDAAVALARDTTFSLNGNCTWMDQHYNWSDLVFENRAGESLNLAVNSVADVLHQFYMERVLPEFPVIPLFAALLLVGLASVVCHRKTLKKNRRRTNIL